jgi:iron(III) transport system permease protein
MNPALRLQRALQVWVLLGLLSFALLPWYFLQQTSLMAALPRVWADAETASGWVQAVQHGRPWLWSAVLGLGVCGLAVLRPWSARLQGALLLLGSLTGLLGLLGSGFAIGATGWSFAALETLWGALPVGQYGMGWGAAVTLLSLLVLLGAALARLGGFRGDVFVAAAVVGCTALLVLFVVYPVLRSLVAAWVDDAGGYAWTHLFERVATERVWGLGCVQGEGRCGVAWNTLWLAFFTATGTTIMGTLLALWAERGGTRLSKPLNILAMLPIITPPFVVGLGLILLFGRAGLFNQGLEWAFGIEPGRWFYGVFGIWLAQMFAFTPIAFLIMRGVVQGVSPSMEEAAQTLRASRMKTFWTVTLPLLKPGLANAFLVGFIESMADFGNPMVLGGNFTVLSTEIFFAIVGSQNDQARAAVLALILLAFTIAAFAAQNLWLGRKRYITVSGKGEGGMHPPLPRSLAVVAIVVTLSWTLFTLVVYGLIVYGSFVELWGRNWSLTLRHYLQGFEIAFNDHGLHWKGSAWNSLATTLKIALISAPLTAAIGLLTAWLRLFRLRSI